MIRNTPHHREERGRTGFIHDRYIMMVPPPHVPTPVFSISALGRYGFLSCRTAWVNGRKSACKSYVSSLSSSAKLSPRTQIGRIQSYSKRILLNTPRIQDSRFKVPGRTLPCTLNLESWIRGVFNRIRLNTERCGLTIAFCISSLSLFCG